MDLIQQLRTLFSFRSNGESSAREIQSNKGLNNRADEGEQKTLINELESLWTESQMEKQVYSAHWAEDLNYYIGEQWNDTTKLDWANYITLNGCFPTVETQVAIETDMKPRIEFQGWESSDEVVAHIYGKIMDYIWFKRRLSRVMSRALRTRGVLGTSFLNVYWDKLLPHGGDINVKAVDPRRIYPSPGATCLDDAAYLIYETSMNLRDAKRLWLEKLQNIKQEDLGNDPNYRSSLLSKQWGGGNKTDLQILEFWIRSDALASAEEYPNGRLVIVAYNLPKPIILHDGPNFYDHGRFPFIEILNYPQLESSKTCPFWGISEMYHLKSPQRYINKVISRMLDSQDATGGRKIVMDRTCGVNTKKITNRPGEIYSVRPGSRFDFVDEPPVPSYPIAMQNTFSWWIDTISGVHDVTQGRTPGGIEAAKAIGYLQEAGQTRVRLKGREFEAALEDMGMLVMSMIEQFYTEERKLRIVGDEAYKFGEQLAAIAQENPEAVRVVENLLATGEKKLVVGYIGAEMKKIKSAEFDVTVELTIGTNRAQLAKSQKAAELYRIGVMSKRRVLLESQYSDADEIIEEQKREMLPPEAPDDQQPPGGMPGTSTRFSGNPAGMLGPGMENVPAPNMEQGFE